MALLSKFTCVYAAAIAAAVSLCSRASATMNPSTITTERLYGEIAGPSLEDKPNFIFSPLSIFSVFHAAQKGAAGETKKQMDALVGPKESFDIPDLTQPRGEKGAVTVDVANRLYLHPELEGNKHFKAFKDRLGGGKHSAETINFQDSVAAAMTMNAFVAEMTRGHIKNLISASALGVDTRLVLINALYFKAPWLTQFSETETSTDVFFTPFGPKEVLFMKGKLDAAPLLVSLRREAVAIGLPYSDARLRLYIVMPDDLQSYERTLVNQPETLESLISDMEGPSNDRPFEEELHVSIPKFKLSAEANKVDLTEVFAALGATDMFSMAKANFSGITGSRDLSVSSFVHQADIEVNEEGTEATAASAMIMMLRAMPVVKTPVNVVINKPFLFQLRFVDGDTSLILFSGRVADPSTAQ